MPAGFADGIDDEGGSTIAVINDLDDVNTAGVTDGQVIKWVDAASEWRPAEDVGGGSGDNWGTQVAVTDINLNGDGTAGDPLGIMGGGIAYDHLSFAVQESIQAGGGAGDDWGTQAVETDVSLTGDGTTGDELGIATGGVGYDNLSTAVQESIQAGGGADGDWTISGDDLYSAISGNVGIGTTSPAVVLDVYGTQIVSETSDGIVNIGETSGKHVTLDENEIHARDGAATSDLFINDFGGRVFIANNAIYAESGGDVGIGTVSPDAQLHIEGQIKIVGGSPGLGKVLTSDATGLATWETPGGGTDDDWTISGSNMYSAVSGNVGIGIATPSHKLHVVTDGGIAAGYFANQSPSLDYFGVYGACANTDYYGYGGYFKGGYIGAYGFVEPTGNLYYMGVSGYVTGGSGDNYGVRGSSYGGETNYGVYGIASGGTTNYGVYGETSGGTTNWAGYFNGDAYFDGDIGIGVPYPAFELDVAGHAKFTADCPAIRLYGSETGGESWMIQEYQGCFGIRSYLGSSWYFFLTIESDGKVGIGTFTPTRKLFVNGDAGGTGAWHNDSDERLKKNIITIPNALDKVEKLRGVQFEWKETENHAEGQQIGFIAQEVLPILPEVVDKPGEYYGMQYAPITALLVEAMKEQQKVIEKLEAENEAIKARLDAIEDIIEQ